MEEGAATRSAMRGVAVGRQALPLVGPQVTCGEVFVEQPETAGSAVSRYTTYLVRGELRGGPVFRTRRRYSDFEWLRKVLVAHFPGIVVPQIPKKQRTGRFEEAFIEARRAGLEEFLQRCFRRKFIAMQSPLLARFLEASEEDLEDLKKKLEARPLAEKCKEFKVAFAQELRKIELPPDDSRLMECRSFVESQLVSLKELSTAVGKVAEAQRAVTSAVTAAQRRLGNVCQEESGVLTETHSLEQPRVELLASLRQQNEVMEGAPALHYDVFLSAIEWEFDDAEAMSEALETLDALQKHLQETKKKKVVSIENTQKRVELGEKPSMLGQIWAGKKDKEGQLQSLRRDVDEASEEAVMAEEWYVAARTIAIGQEIDMFLAEKVAIHRWAKEAFANRLHGTLQSLAQVWGALAPPE